MCPRPGLSLNAQGRRPHAPGCPGGHSHLALVRADTLVFGPGRADRRYCHAALQALPGIEQKWPGLLGRLFTRRLQGLDNFAAAFAALEDKSSIKVTVEISAQ